MAILLGTEEEELAPSALVEIHPLTVHIPASFFRARRFDSDTLERHASSLSIAKRDLVKPWIFHSQSIQEIRLLIQEVLSELLRPLIGEIVSRHAIGNEMIRRGSYDARLSHLIPP